MNTTMLSSFLQIDGDGNGPARTTSTISHPRYNFDDLFGASGRYGAGAGDHDVNLNVDDVHQPHQMDHHVYTSFFDVSNRNTLRKQLNNNLVLGRHLVTGTAQTAEH